MLFLPSCLPVSMLEWHGALGLARIEWIFFLFAIIVSYYSIAIIVPCFGFRMRIAHNVLVGLAVLTMSQGLFSFSCCSASREAESAQEAEKEHSWKSWPQLAKGILHAIWHHAEQGMGQLVWELATAAQELEGNCLAGDEIALSITSLVYSFIIITTFPFFSVKLALS